MSTTNLPENTMLLPNRPILFSVTKHSIESHTVLTAVMLDAGIGEDLFNVVYVDNALVAGWKVNLYGDDDVPTYDLSEVWSMWGASIINKRVRGPLKLKREVYIWVEDWFSSHTDEEFICAAKTLAADSNPEEATWSDAWERSFTKTRTWFYMLLGDAVRVNMRALELPIESEITVAAEETKYDKIMQQSHTYE
jgi:hypothetical protein